MKMDTSYLNTLNESQHEAVVNLNGPLMVIAGAGSGKTRVLTFRIAHLMNHGIDAFNILALTFTNKAAREMKSRIGDIVGKQESRNLWMGTFHAVFARILRAEATRLGYTANFVIYDTADSISVITKIINDLQLNKDIYKPKQVLSRISQYKNNLITVRAYQNSPELQENDAAAMRPMIGKIYEEYVKRCFKSDAMDFDDLLLRTNELLTVFPAVLAKYQDRFKYILVDEYQDTNHSQYLIVKALASRYENICVVGDDAQSIYAFRGANIQNILNFQNDYPDAVLVRLEQNYRSSKMIVQAANAVIANNKNQFPKVVWTANEEGNRIKVYRALSDGEEGRYIAKTIFEKAFNQQRTYDDFVVLYRTNMQSRAIEEALRKKNIPYKIFGGVSFYQRFEIKNVLSYLRLLINSNDNEALLRIINYPKRGIGQTSLNKLMLLANQHQMSIYEAINALHLIVDNKELNQSVIKKLKDFHLMMETYRMMSKTQDAFEISSYIVRTSGIIKELKEDDTPEGISRYENTQELLNSIKSFVEEEQQIDGGNPSLSGFLENVALASDLDTEDDNSNPKVSLMTIHLAKGLEFPIVMIAGMEEELFPSILSLNSRTDLEEERRLFYVALTRGEKEVYLSYATTRYRWGKLVDVEPSRFIDEINEEYLDTTLAFPKQNVIINHSGLNTSIFGATVFENTKNKPQRALDRKLKTLSNPNNSATTITTNTVVTVGMKIEHERFGRGMVTQLEGAGDDIKITIKFELIGEKKLLYKFAQNKLKILAI